jgi:hypothetical protein
MKEVGKVYLNEKGEYIAVVEGVERNLSEMQIKSLTMNDVLESINKIMWESYMIDRPVPNKSIMKNLETWASKC